jgi:hypothetical protein
MEAAIFPVPTKVFEAMQRKTRGFLPMAGLGLSGQNSAQPLPTCASLQHCYASLQCFTRRYSTRKAHGHNPRRLARLCHKGTSRQWGQKI